MAHILTDQELKEFLHNPKLSDGPKYPPFLFGGHVFSERIDIYTSYLMEQFDLIDNKYYLPKQRNDNKGMKGELLMCGIIDLTMWAFGYRLEQDYTVIHPFGPKGGNTVDFKLTCHDTVFLCEAKNWDISTYVDKKTYDEKIKTRFFCDGMNILMILRNKITSIEKMYSRYSTDNGHPINYLQISNFMGVSGNDIDYVNVNLLLGVNQMLNFILRKIEMDRDFSLMECLQMRMPTWFIIKYLNINKRTVSRKAKNLGYNRRGADYKELVKYRNIR